MYIMYYIYDIIGTYISFNTKIYTHLKEYLILSGLCTTSVDCDGEQSCISGVCGMYIYTVDLYSYCHDIIIHRNALFYSYKYISCNFQYVELMEREAKAQIKVLALMNRDVNSQGNVKVTTITSDKGYYYFIRVDLVMSRLKF